MKKITIAMLIGLLIIILSGCSGNRDDRKSYEKQMNKLIANIDHAEPQEVIRIIFWAQNNHRKDVYANCLSTRQRKFYLAPNTVDPEFTSTDYIRIVDIREEKATITPESYRVWGQGSITKPYDVKIFWVDYEVKYNRFMAQDSGKHGWNYILIREKKNSPWKIDDWGY